jgi:hypothetical protein
MKVYAPQVSVKLIKAQPRKDLVDGLPVAAVRYGDLAAIDLTPYLGDTGSVRTTKGVRECAGDFTITFADKPHRDAQDQAKSKLETLYALIEPMDLVEIRMCHDISDPAYKGAPPIVMRGFVSTITRSETMSGGRPQRTITVAGQDFGKVLQILQIFYLNNSAVGDNLLSELGFFQKYALAEEAKNKSANDFVKDIVEKVVNPYLARIVSLAHGETVSAKIVNKWTVKASIEGTVSPYSVSSFVNVSLDQMLEQLLDVGPFNELYVEDTEDGVQLVVRPAPFLNVKGEPIQGVKPEAIEVDIADVIDVGLNRTDAGVANYFWVTDTRWTMMSNQDAQLAAQTGNAANFVLFEYPNCKASLYGIRKMEVQTQLGDPDYSQSDAVPADDQPDQVTALSAWLDKRRKILADANKDNVLFEAGTMSVRGNEKLKAGMQLLLKRGSGKVTGYYIVKVEHDFQPFQGFTSSLTLERGTNFIVRSQAEKPVYFSEMSGSVT